MSPTPSPSHRFLQRCDPRAKLGFFLLLLPVFLAQPPFSAAWLAAALLVALAWIGAAAPPLRPSDFTRSLWRLRWLFLALLLTHGYLTPGEPLWPGPLAPAREGLSAGLHQSLRLILLVALAWSLMRTTTPLQLVTAFRRLFRWLEGTPFSPQRTWALLAFTLERIPRLMHIARGVRTAMGLRLPPGSPSARLTRLVMAAEALLYRLSRDVSRQEEALLARGFSHGLPQPPLPNDPLGWRDLLLLVPPGGVLLSIWLG